MNEFQFLENLYHKEHERRSEILNSLNLTLLVLSALVTGIFYLITTFDFSFQCWEVGIFIFLMVIATGGIVWALFYLIGAMNNFMRGFEYKGLPSMTAQFEWKRNLILHYRNVKNVKHSKRRAQREFIADLKLKLIDSIDSNSAINDLKTKRIYQSKTGLSVTLIALVLAMIPYFHVHFSSSRIIDSTNCCCLTIDQESLNLLYQINSDSIQSNHHGKRQARPTTTTTFEQGDS